MEYVEQSDIEAKIPPQFIIEALDDDEDGVADPGAWDQVVASVSDTINGKLGQRYPVPFVDPIPAIVKDAARILASSALYKRRGMTADKNPWAKDEADMLKKLDAIAKGDEPLTPALQRQKPSVSAITEKAKTFSMTGNLIV